MFLVFCLCRIMFRRRVRHSVAGGASSSVTAVRGVRTP